MKMRTVTFMALWALLGTTSLQAQEQADPAHVYEAFYRISYADLEEYNRQYWEYSVPILTELQEEGVIEGWTQWEHHTGGEYNIRFAARTFDWASFDTFWSQYLSRLEDAMTAAEWDSSNRMLQAHQDEIWNVAQANVPAGLQASYLYTASFRLNFADMPEWDRIWTELQVPILNEAMNEGLLGWWVKLNHNTGGPHNSKTLFLFEDWDDIDDLLSKLLGTLAEQHPADFRTLNEMFREHNDIIWVPTPSNGN